MANGRCRMHGGQSTGPRTDTGRERIKLARLKHGEYSQEMREANEEIRWMKRMMKDVLEAE